MYSLGKTLMVLFGSALLLVGCATGKLDITSSPEGASILKIESSGNAKVIGKTPMSVDVNNFTSSSESYVHLAISKEKFRREAVIIPRNMFEASHTLNFKLTSINESGSLDECPKLPENSFSELARGVAEAQTMITEKDFSAAENKLQVLTAQFPFVSVLYDFIGNIKYLQKNLNGALKAYEKSLELWPHNPQTTRMVNKIRGMTGNLRSGG